jgi:hypothetical protein
MELEFELYVTSYYKRFDALFVVLSEITNWYVLPQKMNLNLSQADVELLPRKFFDSNFNVVIHLE